MAEPAKIVFGFGNFRLHNEGQVLLRDGQLVSLTPKALDTLLVLVRNHGRVVPKEEIINSVWPDTFVEEGNLTWCISAIRKALANSSEDPHYIETVPKRGYRFVGAVSEFSDEGKSSQAVPLENPPACEEGSMPAVQVEPAAEPRYAGIRSGLPSSWNAPFLAKIALALLLAGLLTVLYAFYYAPEGQAEAPVNPKVIAILPFQSLSAQELEEPLGLGIADSLISKLSNVTQLRVRPTSAIRKYAGAGRDTVAAGRDLRVESVLEGSILRVGDRIRVTVQLVDVKSGSPVWSNQFDEKFTDILAIEDSIAEQMANALTLRLGKRDKSQLVKQSTENVIAYEAYVSGRFLWNRATAEDYWKAIGYFQEATRQDPRYALAYLGLADCYFELAWLGARAPGELMPQALQAATKALELDPSLAEAHAALARVKLHFDWDWPGAEAGFRRALELSPNYSRAHRWYSQYLTVMGRTGESLAESRRALELDPLNLRMMVHLGWHHLHARQYDQAIDRLRRTLEIDSNLAFGTSYLGIAYLQKGMHNEANSALLRAVDLFKRSPRSEAEFGAAAALLGRTEEAQGVLRKLQEISREEYISPRSIAVIYAGLNQRDLAFQWLDRAVTDRSMRLVYLKSDPMLDSLRSDARFDSMVSRLRLPQ